MREEHQELVDLARRIVLRHQQGRLTIAAELIVRALATSDTEHTFGLAVALTDQALLAVESNRIDALAAGRPWRPGMTTPSGELITPADSSAAPVPLALRMIEAMHRGMNGDKDAITELGVIYDTAAADATVLHAFFAALATYAAQGLSGQMQIITGPATTDSGANRD